MKLRKLNCKPMCAVCKRPVDTLVEWEDPVLCRVHWRVTCHGRYEEVHLDDFELAHLGIDGLRFVTAFQPKKVPLLHG